MSHMGFVESTYAQRTAPDVSHAPHGFRRKHARTADRSRRFPRPTWVSSKARTRSGPLPTFPMPHMGFVESTRTHSGPLPTFPMSHMGFAGGRARGRPPPPYAGGVSAPPRRHRTRETDD